VHSIAAFRTQRVTVHSTQPVTDATGDSALDTTGVDTTGDSALNRLDTGLVKCTVTDNVNALSPLFVPQLTS
jgi:hypothetical protein